MSGVHALSALYVYVIVCAMARAAVTTFYGNDCRLQPNSSRPAAALGAWLLRSYCACVLLHDSKFLSRFFTRLYLLIISGKRADIFE